MKNKTIAFISSLAISLAFLMLLINSKNTSEVRINGERIKVEIAFNSAEWSRGLSSYEFLEKNRGMLFIFPDSQIRQFWMKNMKFPIDIIFIYENKTIAGIEKNLPPCSLNCKTYSSIVPVKYVLEVNSGFADENNIAVGMRLSF